ncbi:alpha-L-fucosidase [Promicromonospora sp. AC04]|uniref:alpha-L-fucosidase n=1 Tax=Promicromonospora sp. AC04 TaxID=2135723 RepID=UPI000D4ED039|nr:alpha-L-fucosidase [Promicromonospora sp. AC04]PUB21527.1 alpha-L-fucosidase [Promicromonospora sp. AC04]
MTIQHHLKHLVPTPEQLAWQRLELGMFFHFGMNTFHGKEWSDGTLPASSFDPSELDADEWVRLAVEAGARYVVLTAKHHDGFCLWPTATTDYSVVSSPWREGRGDVVAEVARACRDAGIGLGLYLSPWDRNHPAYADPDAYAEVYAEQLTELCTRYGPLVELWFDGAGSEGYVYDWERTMAIIHEHQPQAMVFNMGAPTIRWVGNEDGIASDPVEYTVSHTQMSNYTIVTTQFADALYLPPECDVSVRRGWFWHPDDEPKTLEHLMAIYYRSVGMGANLLLNVPPDTRGRIDPADAEVIRALGGEIRRRFGAPVPAALERAGDGRWSAVLGDEAVTFDHVLVREDLSRGQRVGAHRLRVDGDDVGSGLTIGANRLHATGTRTARVIELEVDGDDPVIDQVLVYRTGELVAPTVPEGYVAPTAYPED